MKITMKKLRETIREALEHASHDALKALAKKAIADLEAGGKPEEVYTWLAAETDIGGGRHRADAVVGLVKAKDMWLGSKLSRAGRDHQSPPPAYVSPWSGASGRAASSKMYESADVPHAPCRACDGEGSVAGEHCATCGGTGEEIDPGTGRKGIGRGPLPWRL